MVKRMNYQRECPLYITNPCRTDLMCDLRRVHGGAPEVVTKKRPDIGLGGINVIIGYDSIDVIKDQFAMKTVCVHEPGFNNSA